MKLKKKKKKIPFRYNSIVQKSSFTLKLDFLKIKFQNKGIFLNSLRYKAFCWKVCEKGVKSHFGHKKADTRFHQVKLIL